MKGDFGVGDRLILLERPCSAHGIGSFADQLLEAILGVLTGLITVGTMLAHVSKLIGFMQSRSRSLDLRKMVMPMFEKLATLSTHLKTCWLGAFL